MNISNLSYQLIRSKRKTLVIQISLQGIKVKAPLNCPINKINNFINSKQQWINKHLARLPTHLISKYQARQIFILGETVNLSYHNQQLSLTCQTNSLQNYINYPIKLACSTDKEKATLKKFLIQLSRQIIQQRVKYWSTKMKLFPNKIRLSQAKTRWGSASSKGNLNFNWRLVELPVELIDSVVVHELAHLKHLNHSADFWHLVSNYLPNYQVLKQQLKNYCLNIEWEHLVNLEPLALSK